MRLEDLIAIDLIFYDLEAKKWGFSIRVKEQQFGPFVNLNENIESIETLQIIDMKPLINGIISLCCNDDPAKIVIKVLDLLIADQRISSLKIDYYTSISNSFPQYTDKINNYKLLQ